MVGQGVAHRTIEDHFFRGCERNLLTWQVTVGFPRDLERKQRVVAQKGVANGQAIARVLVNKPHEIMVAALCREICKVDFAIAGKTLPRGAAHGKDGSLRRFWPGLIGKCGGSFRIGGDAEAQRQGEQ